MGTHDAFAAVQQRYALNFSKISWYPGTMITDLEAHLDALARTVKCDKDFACLRTGAGKLCMARDIGLEHNVACLEQNEWACRYRLKTALGRFCHCPVRVQMEKLQSQ